MHASIILVTLIALIVTCGTGYAQRPPYDERCRWQCDAYHCNYYHDYCDYDCYEVCYGPYRSVNEALRAQRVIGGVKGVQQQQESSEERTGKSIKMRIENPAFQVVQNGRLKVARGSPSKSFAITQNCLSSQFKTRLEEISQ